MSRAEPVPLITVGIVVQGLEEPGSIRRLNVILLQGATISAALERLPAEIVAAVTTGQLAPALHGTVQPLTSQLQDGDRLELCRALLHDPKEARRQRAAHRPRK